MTTPSLGFTLVELMVTIAVLAILMALGVPAFGNYVASTRVRNVAENFYSGIQKARAEAIRRNGPVEFVLINSGKNWQVRVLDPDPAVESQLIDSKIAAEGGAAAVEVDAGGATRLTFNGLGALTVPPTPPTAVEVKFKHATINSACNDSNSAVRCINVRVSLGGQSRLCEPERAAGDSRGCD